MDRDEMMNNLSIQGQDARSDFNDGLDDPGWFGWHVKGDVLSVSFEPVTDVGNAGPAQIARWKLVPID